MPPRRSTSTPKPAPAPVVREASTKSLFGTSKPAAAVAPKADKAAAALVKEEKDAEEKDADHEFKREYKLLLKRAIARMGPPTHPMGSIDIVLHVFDLSDEYGPCVGLSRLERWERSEKLGLSPPPEIREILLSEEGSKLLKPCFAGI